MMMMIMMMMILICHFPGAAGNELFVYLQTVQSYLASPLTMTYLLGILWTGLTEFGALSGLAVGFLLGLIKFIMGNVFPQPHCGEIDDRPGFVKMHFMFYGKSFLNEIISIFTSTSFKYRRNNKR